MYAYYTSTRIFNIVVQKGLQGLRPHKYSIFGGYLKKLPIVTEYKKGVR